MTQDTTDGAASAAAAPFYPGSPPDPLNAAIAATAGEPISQSEAFLIGARTTTSEGERAAAMEAYIQAGVAKAVAPLAGHEVVPVSKVGEVIAALFRHLHLDHPENYLPK